MPTMASEHQHWHQEQAGPRTPQLTLHTPGALPMHVWVPAAQIQLRQTALSLQLGCGGKRGSRVLVEAAQHGGPLLAGMHH